MGARGTGCYAPFAKMGRFFCGETVFQWEFPCHPTDLVYFRKRIGEAEVKKIFQVSIELHGTKAKEKEVLVDTTAQEKNITFPTDATLCKRIIAHCVDIANKERITVRQSYRRTTKKLLLAQRFRSHPKNRKKAVAAQRKLKTIAGRLVRSWRGNCPQTHWYTTQQSCQSSVRSCIRKRTAPPRSPVSTNPRYTASAKAKSIKNMNLAQRPHLW